jgi:hypothetical protein
MRWGPCADVQWGIASSGQPRPVPHLECEALREHLLRRGPLYDRISWCTRFVLGTRSHILSLPVNIPHSVSIDAELQAVARLFLLVKDVAESCERHLAIHKRRT